MEQQSGLEVNNAWEQLPDEPAEAYRAFKFFLGCGSARTLRSAYQASQTDPREGGAPPGSENAQIQASTYDDWKRWHVEFRWDQRARAYDAWLAKRMRAQVLETQRERVMQMLQMDRVDHRRIEALGSRLAALDSAPQVRAVMRIGGTTITRDSGREYALLSKEYRALRDRYFSLAEPVLNAAQEDTAGHDENRVQRIAGSFSIGNTMYDGSDPPTFERTYPEGAEPEAVKREKPFELDLSGLGDLYKKKDDDEK
jgi:hypothetical protein